MEKGKTEFKNQIDMTSGGLLKKILVFALPIALSSVLQQLFNSVDIAVVGNFASSSALAAVGSNAPVINLFINLFVGLSVGANVVIAGFIGSNKNDKIKQAVSTSFIIALFSGIALLVAGEIAAEPILTAMGAPSDVIDLAAIYLRIYFLGMPFFMIYNFGSAILRSVGDTKRPMYILAACGGVNALLNLWFVIGFNMSADGVATATVISNGLSAYLIIRILRKENEPLKLNLRELKIDKKILRQVLAIGVPAGLQGVVFSISNVFIQTCLNGFGSAVVAGSAAAVNFEYFNYYIINAFGQSAVTFTSQNYGAGKLQRCLKSFFTAFALAAVSSLALTAVFMIFRNEFLSFYTNDAEIIPYGLERMQHIIVYGALISTYEVSACAMRGFGYSNTPTILTVLGTCVLRIVWIFTVFKNDPDYGVLLDVYPVSWLITGIACLAAYAVIYKRVKNKSGFDMQRTAA